MVSIFLNECTRVSSFDEQWKIARERFQYLKNKILFGRTFYTNVSDVSVKTERFLTKLHERVLSIKAPLMSQGIFVDILRTYTMKIENRNAGNIDYMTFLFICNRSFTSSNACNLSPFFSNVSFINYTYLNLSCDINTFCTEWVIKKLTPDFSYASTEKIGLHLYKR